MSKVVKAEEPLVLAKCLPFKPHTGPVEPDMDCDSFGQFLLKLDGASSYSQLFQLWDAKDALTKEGVFLLEAKNHVVVARKFKIDQGVLFQLHENDKLLAIYKSEKENEEEDPIIEKMIINRKTEVEKSRRFLLILVLFIIIMALNPEKKKSQDSEPYVYYATEHDI